MRGHSFNRRGRDLVVVAVCVVAVVVCAAALIALVVSLVERGAPLLSLAYVLDLPSRAGLDGGVASVLVSTLLLLGIALVCAVPLGVLTAVALTESSTLLPSTSSLVSRSLDVLTGVPSIVFGLFGMKLFCELLGLGWSIAAGGLTLACMVLPLVARATELGLRAVPLEVRRSCVAVGASRVGILWHVLLPAAAPSIAAGVVLGVGRALAESAAVLFTAGQALRMPTSLVDPGRALAVHIYTLSIEVPGGAPRAAAASLLLLLLVAVTTATSQALLATFLRRTQGAVGRA